MWPSSPPKKPSSLNIHRQFHHNLSTRGPPPGLGTARGRGRGIFSYDCRWSLAWGIELATVGRRKVKSGSATPLAVTQGSTMDPHDAADAPIR
ncbi:unnamed protein product [Linum trigynum]|uniref:Uncharacterized protein n=1 Tax=Linum trigynum TaxID=586398 RepID=A0AAV2D7X2_9ROSI